MLIQEIDHRRKINGVATELSQPLVPELLRLGSISPNPVDKSYLELRYVSAKLLSKVEKCSFNLH